MTERGSAETPLTIVVGPTASGKTELAVRWAEERGAEIVSADSVQVYRYFDIGTGKPSAEEHARARHHLVSVLEPSEPMDAALWAERAERTILEIRGRGREPVVCGGSFLWVKALLFGLAGAPAADPAIRARHRERAEREGRPALHAELARVDPESAARLAPNDLVRVSRALEVFEQSGVPLSRFQAEHGFRAPRYAARLVGVRREPAELDRRIEARVRAMFAAGWIDEVRALLAAGHEQTRAMSAVGYKQVAAALRGEAPIDTESLTIAVVRATRIFARRQRTWLRDQNVEWTEPLTPSR
ncbi:MAG TPA: tRNA (adenosine(37)-N6)-dimethylallyltransferase MiaA [Polyangiaceae bacterium]|nr:tRNA (adenosine(37)-N6)-dimethylallyltransferase MiaA [Polyangiaceae bacterium]